ncbi:MULTISPECIES: chemotaxis protein CheW [Clostridium]|uniref:chemotaxis protein CheW n=1 Tax=Clostridium TaxID=1485 RepID=UPI00069F0A56|nr:MULTISPECIES: chemotaxis protein CheW [Clostridium]KOF55900.1 chemotaxis protein CheW [Clostridium sp. DMHC 10]MCD2345280.1 chemotaxis protein CheW [Clostridium guangxiense]
MDNKELKILIFSVNGEYYATDIMEVERILGYEPTTKLPDVPEFVDGVINYEGKVLPVISLSKRFNIENSKITSNSKLIVVKYENGKIGVIVDLVSEVKDVSSDNVEEPPEVVSGISKRYLEGLIKMDNKIIIFLNMAQILSEEEKKLL